MGENVGAYSFGLVINKMKKYTVSNIQLYDPLLNC